MMQRRLASIMIGIVSLVLATSFAQAFDYNRAVANYRAVIAGTKKLESLTAEEKAEVLTVYRAQRPMAPRGASSACRDAWDRASSAADDLESYAGRLQRCAANRDFSDDCYTEARRTRSAHDDYSSAASDVQSECS